MTLAGLSHLDTNFDINLRKYATYIDVAQMVARHIATAFSVALLCSRDHMRILFYIDCQGIFQFGDAFGIGTIWFIATASCATISHP